MRLMRMDINNNNAQLGKHEVDWLTGYSALPYLTLPR